MLSGCSFVGMRRGYRYDVLFAVVEGGNGVGAGGLAMGRRMKSQLGIVALLTRMACEGETHGGRSDDALAGAIVEPQPRGQHTSRS